VGYSSGQSYIEFELNLISAIGINIFEIQVKSGGDF
jgi:hypothetical protein